jgi:3-phenylpropionate/trans-cinnamate dioxygenase ferredoxin reductase component
MFHYKYLIIGGGMTADAAVKGIRSLDKVGKTGIITSEPYPPYKRPPLSKGLWKGDNPESIWMDSAKTQADIHSNLTAIDLDIALKKVTDNKGNVYSYTKLLIAAGGNVRVLPFDCGGIIYFRTFADYKNLRFLTSTKKRILVIGGGFIGSELAAALSINGHKVTMIFPEKGIGARVYPKSLSVFLNEYYISKGVEIIAKESVEDIRHEGNEYFIRTLGGMEIRADIVVAGIGIVPNIELAQSAGLSTGNGIIVNEFLQTSDPDVFAAGDVANFYNPLLNSRIRVEHEDNANMMGEYAGKNMTDANVPYDYLPFFYSDLFDFGYEAVGETDNHLVMVEDWKEEFKEGVIYYLDKGRVRGVLLWNTWGQLDNARKLIGETGPHEPSGLKGRI